MRGSGIDSCSMGISVKEAELMSSMTMMTSSVRTRTLELSNARTAKRGIPQAYFKIIFVIVQETIVADLAYQTFT